MLGGTSTMAIEGRSDHEKGKGKHINQIGRLEGDAEQTAVAKCGGTPDAQTMLWLLRAPSRVYRAVQGVLGPTLASRRRGPRATNLGPAGPSTGRRRRARKRPVQRGRGARLARRTARSARPDPHAAGLSLAAVYLGPYTVLHIWLYIYGSAETT